jgi:hypothetical protein
MRRKFDWGFSLTVFVMAAADRREKRTNDRERSQDMGGWEGGLNTSHILVNAPISRSPGPMPIYIVYLPVYLIFLFFFWGYSDYTSDFSICPDSRSGSWSVRSRPNQTTWTTSLRPPGHINTKWVPHIFDCSGDEKNKLKKQNKKMLNHSALFVDLKNIWNFQNDTKDKKFKNSWLGFSIKMCRLKYPAFDPFKYYLYRIFYFVCSISLANFVMQFCLVGSRWNLSLEAEATLKSKCNWQQPTRPNIENLRKRKKENVGTFWRAKKGKKRKTAVA